MDIDEFVRFIEKRCNEIKEIKLPKGLGKNKLIMVVYLSGFLDALNEKIGKNPI
jgi:hypothetical protein